MQVVDALIVTLGLDSSEFVKGQAEADSAFGKTKDSARKAGKDIEKSGKDMSEALGKATSGVLTLMAAFLGGQGLKQFIGDAVRANTALGNVSATLGTSSQFVSAWSMAAERMGGSAAATQGSLQALSDSLINLNAKGKTPPVELFMLEADSKKHIDLAHGLDAYTISLASASHELAKTDSAKASNFLRALGIDPVTANLLIKQGDNMRSYLQTIKRLAPSDRDVKVSSQLTESWSRLSQQFSLLASKIATAIGPALIYLADKIGMVVEAVARWVEANPGLTTAIVGFIGLLSAGGILLAIKNILGLAGALRGLAAANALTAAGGAGGLLGLLGRLGLGGLALGGGYATGRALGDAAGIGEYDPYGGDKRYHTDKDGKLTYEGGAPPSRAHGEGADGIRRRAHHAGEIPDGKAASLSANQQEAYNAARGEGLSDKAARALVANMSGEALAKPHDVHWDVSHYAHGIVQWSDDRAAKIKAQFGKMPQNMTVAEQTKAAIWEIRNNKVYSKTADALNGDNSGAMMGALVSNYENPRDKDGQIRARSRIYQGLGHLNEGYHPGGAAPAYNPDHPPLPAPPPFHSKTPPMAAPPIWTGSLDASRKALRAGAPHSAALNNIANDNRATTSSTSNEAHVHGDININAPQATDAHGIARNIDGALAHNLFANYANVGPY